MMKAEYIEKALDLVSSTITSDESWSGHDQRVHQACANHYMRALRRGDLALDEDHLALLCAHTLSALALRIETAEAVAAAMFEADWFPQPAAGVEAAPAK
jgi:hypothetical protein